MTATRALRAEHDTILAVLACLRAACRAAEEGRFDGGTFRQAVDFIRNYADAWHHAKEEGHLFPALEEAGVPREGGPVGVMLMEHDMGRRHVAAMARALDAAEGGDAAARRTVVEHALGYADLLDGHIAKENRILFEMADRILPAEVQRRLEAAYREARPEGADPDAGARYEALALDLCARWGVDPEAVVREHAMRPGCHGY